MSELIKGQKVFDAYAAYYDLLYEDKDYAGEALYVRGLLARYGVAGGTILELGCGTGKHAEQLARLGYSVHGIDLSSSMILAADAHKPDHLDGQLVFEEGDVRNARLHKTFDAVVSLFHVASYQTANADLRAMFETSARHLAPGGIFVFDFWYGPAVLTLKPETRVKWFENDVCRVQRVAEPRWDIDENRVDVEYDLLVEEKASGQWTRIHENHPMRYFFKPEMALLLEISGFSIEFFGTWMAEQPADSDSWSAVVVARRAQ